MPLYSESIHALNVGIDRSRARRKWAVLLLPTLVQRMGDLASAIMNCEHKTIVAAAAMEVAVAAIRIAEEHDSVVYAGSPTVEAVARIGAYVESTIASRSSVATGHLQHLGNIVDQLVTAKQQKRMRDVCFARREGRRAKS